jgi:putative DNA primase/helicase
VSTDQLLDLTEEIKAANALAKDLPDITQVMREWAALVATMSPLDRQAAIEDKAKVLKALVQSPMALINAALKEVGAGGNGRAKPEQPGLSLDDPEPWPEEVDGADLLDDLAATYARFVALPDAAEQALALYTVLTYVPDCFFVLPMMSILSAVKRSGKTTALAVAGALVSRPLPASNITPAALFRSVDKHHPTLLIDEADSFLGENEEMRGILNAGHTRATAYVIRTTGDDFEPMQFSVWCPKMLAGIGKFAATLEDRSIIIRARRRAPGEKIERLRLDRLGELKPLCRKCRRWADDHLVALGIADPEIPDLASDRAADNWRPLLAIAQAAGGEWYAQARWASIVLSGCGDESDGASVTLLEDIRGLFADQGTDRLTSDEIVHALAKMEERPWPEWYHGKPITARQVAKLLHGFGIKPKVVRVGERTPRGYDLCEFGDAWTRYLSSPPSSSATSVTSLQNGTFSSATPTWPVADEKHPICREVADVTDETPQPGTLPLSETDGDLDA